MLLPWQAQPYMALLIWDGWPCKVLPCKSCFRHPYNYLVPPGYILFTLHPRRRVTLLQPWFLCGAPGTCRRFLILQTDSLHSRAKCFARCFCAFTASHSLSCLITSLHPWSVLGRISWCPAEALAGYTAWFSRGASCSQWVSSNCWHTLVSKVTANHLHFNYLCFKYTWISFLCILHLGCMFRSKAGITSYVLINTPKGGTGQETDYPDFEVVLPIAPSVKKRPSVATAPHALSISSLSSNIWARITHGNTALTAAPKANSCSICWSTTLTHFF